MNRIWILVLSFAIPGLTQLSSNTTLFLMSGPDVLHGGTPTPLAFTVFTNFSGNITAEVAHGNTKIAQTEDFQGGLTKILTLPPFPGSVAPNSPLNLTVWGYTENSLIFTNTTTLSFNPKNVFSIILTDRSLYKPADTVRIRVVSVQLDKKPYKGRVEMSVLDPSRTIVDRWTFMEELGIFLKEFSLSQASPFGQWVISATVNGLTDEKGFTVEDRGNMSTDNPPFDVLFRTLSQVLLGDDISGSVTAFYPNGQPVRGTLVVTVTLESLLLTQTKTIYGSTKFFFSRDQLQAFTSSSAFSSNSLIFHITAHVNDSMQLTTVNKTVEVHLVRDKFHLMFLNFPPSLKPSLHFSTNLRISRYDGKPLSPLDLNHLAVVEVTQKTLMMNAESTTLTLPVPKDGNVLIQFKLYDQAEMLLLRAKFQSSEETLKVYNNNSSSSGSYIQIYPVNTLPAQIGSPFQLNVESTFKPATLHFVVGSKGQVVAAGTKNFSPTLDLTPLLSWYPEACVTVYCILSDGEIISDTASIPIHQNNHLTLSWSSVRAQPGEQVSLTVAASESRFQVAIVVMGMPNDAPRSNMDWKVEQKCHLKMMTNVAFNEKTQPDGPKNDSDTGLIIEKYWSQWIGTTESLLWLDTHVSDKNWTSGEITVPAGVTSLGALALVMSENLGLSFTPVPLQLTVSKDFSLSFIVPPYVIRQEEIVLEVNVTSHLDHDVAVIVFIAQTEAFEFVLMDRRDASVINAQRLTLGSRQTASAIFSIKLLALGEKEISVVAMSAEASNTFTQRVMVKPEGVEQSISQSLFLELTAKQNDASSVSFSFPPDVVPGSQRAQIALVGDILALSIKHLDSLVQMPTGCGEQNMIHFAPSVYVLQYLDKSGQDDSEIRNKALSCMTAGYQNQLSYQRDDGSFSAFGQNDSSGSIWLTAFVLRCFLQAQPYIQIDESIVTSAMTWLLKHQGPRGEFVEVGKLIHTEMQGGLDDDSVALTAYVLLAFLEEETYSGKYVSNVSLALKYLESKVSGGVIHSNYSLCLVAYALALANSPTAAKALSELSRRDDYTDDVMMWTSSAGLSSLDQQPSSAQIEMTSYVLLAFFMRGSFIEGISLVKWLSRQRNHLGGFGTTQDTVIALQALANYAAFSGASAIDLRFNISSSTSPFVSLFHINSTNYRTYQSQEINAEKDLALHIYMEGRGFAIFQLNVFYNVKSKNVSQNVKQTSDEDAFSLTAHLNHSDTDHMTMSVCTRLKDSQPIPHTGMAILDVGMLSSFTLLPGAAVEGDFFRRVDRTPTEISLYLDSVNKSDVCFRLPLVRNYKVARVQDAVLQVYDYYEPTRKTTKTYNSDFLHKTDSCFFCGEKCNLCRPSITITVTTPAGSHSGRGTSYSLICLCLGVAAFLVVV
ncbi:CD109 antigen [Kryptolebias marmoratus]|uniref:CD109 molecule n=1 Tax=Kryptolebias marmoratus TaxID=37003 RepID=A0A3Q3ARN5_KRYMA|nr:CD109 antigen [Kryptolebias marmoratus]